MVLWGNRAGGVSELEDRQNWRICCLQGHQNTFRGQTFGVAYVVKITVKSGLTVKELAVWDSHCFFLIVLGRSKVQFPFSCLAGLPACKMSLIYISPALVISLCAHYRQKRETSEVALQLNMEWPHRPGVNGK